MPRARWLLAATALMPITWAACFGEAAANAANSPPTACIASEKPLGMLIPVDQRSAPLVAIAAYHPHAQSLRIVRVSWRAR